MLLLWCVWAVNAKAETTDRWTRTLQKVSRSVVTIRVDAAPSFDTAGASSSQATGFVVDADRGLILTNRHVVQAGPVSAEALFSNREEVKLKPVYRDPVHDFGFFQYDPAKLKFIKPVSLPLKPALASIGMDIRVLGNDAGEQLSILAGTLARLDRGAPYYGRARYNDFNTFYYQSASGVSGGSSGSPVIDVYGNVIALNAGGSKQAASSFFLPLYRVVRVLKLLQQGKPVTRGTLQTTFDYQPYDVARRLGLRPQMEAKLRKVSRGVGLLIVKHTLPGGPADKRLQPGDILLKAWADDQQPQWMRRFEKLEDLLDNHVNRPIHMLVERRGKETRVDLNVQDLHEITPDRYITFGGAVVHNLSYQQARHLNRPVQGVYIAQTGYVFSTAGIPAGAVITGFNRQPVKNLDDMEHILDGMADQQQAVVSYISFSETRRPQLSVMVMDRHWYPAKKCHRDDNSGLWPCDKLAAGPAPQPPEPGKVRFAEYKDPAANRLSPSLVYVQYDIPYNVNGLSDLHFGGGGIVLDAKHGLVLVDRNTVPEPMGDARIIFGGAMDIPAKVVFVHPLHNFAILQYDPALVQGDAVKSAQLTPKKLEAGDDVYLVGIKGDQSLFSVKQKVASIEPLDLGVPPVPSYRESNLDVITLNNAPPSHGGVLANKNGEVLAQWASFAYDSGNDVKQFEMGIPIDLVKDLMDRWQECHCFKVHSLGLELAALSVAQASKLGLDEDWLERFQTPNGRRQVLAVARRVAGSDAAGKIRVGDLLLAIDGHMVRTFRDVEKLSQKPGVNLTIVRDGKQQEIEVNTRELNGKGIRHFLQWSGALVQNPHRALASQRGIKPEGVYVSFVWFGSPADRNNLSAVTRIMEINGHKIRDLDDFIQHVKSLENEEFIQLKVMDLRDRVSVLTLRQDKFYWPTREIYRQDGEWESRDL